MTPMRRFYDQDAKLAHSIELLFGLPPSTQSFISEKMETIFDREYRIQELLSDLRSLGAEKILALHSANKKRRAYDTNAYLFKTINYLKILPENDKLALAAKLTGLSGCIEEYVNYCHSLKIKPDSATLHRLVDTYVDKGPIEVSKEINRIKMKLSHRLESEVAAQEPDNQVDYNEMRIRGPL